MSEHEIMRVQREALMKFSGGDRKMIIQIIQQYGHVLREHFDSKSGQQVSIDDLCKVLAECTKKVPSHSSR
jgi:hypothetical protein